MPCVTVLAFLLCYILYLRAISRYKPPWAYIQRGDLMGGSLHYKFGGLIFGGAYTWMGLFSEFYGMCHDLPVENAIADLPSMLKENSKAFPVNKLSLLGGPEKDIVTASQTLPTNI